MSSMLMMVLVLGVVAVGVMKRCDWLGICGGGAAATGASDADNGKSQTCNCCTCTQVNPKLITCDNGSGNITSFTNGLSLDAQCQACGNDANICAGAAAGGAPAKKGKKKKCGCCSCVQTDDKTITCDTGVSSINFTNGLTLDAQCKACAADAKICADAKNQLAAKGVTDAATNALGKDIGIGPKAKCAPGWHFNANNVCVPDGKTQKKDDKVKSAGPLDTGCKKGQSRNCFSAGPGNPLGPPGTPICTCSKYTRVLSNYTNPHHISNMASSRFARVAI